MRQSRRAADGARRQQATGIVQLRFDLGANTSRVFRQLLTENLLLGLLGSLRCAAAKLCGFAIRVALLQCAHMDERRARLARAAIYSCHGFSCRTHLFRPVTTLQMVRRRKDRFAWHQLVVGTQVGATCVLLVLAGLLVRATMHALYTDPGFDYAQVLSIDPGMVEHGFSSSSAQAYCQLKPGLARCRACSRFPSRGLLHW